LTPDGFIQRDESQLWQFRKWLDWAEPLGLGELELKPWEFWRLTVREFDLLLEGFFRRQDRAWEMVGTLGLWVVSPYSKKKLTVLQLLGRSRLRLMPESRESVEAKAAALEEAQRQAQLAKALAWAMDGNDEIVRTEPIPEE